MSAGKLIDGAAFALDVPERVPSVWGDANRVLWAQGEPLMIVGPDGVGKTTLGQQLTLRRAGVGLGARLDFLGHMVTPDADRRVLYLALDRPQQAARSMRRMVREIDRAELERKLVAWKGPLPFDVTREPQRLAAWATELHVGTIVIDSVKDLAGDLSDETTAQAINGAYQHAVSTGIEILALHHQRKAQANAGKPRKLADVYGSRWLTAGCGSVLMLWGEAGDPIVELTHLKQPADEVGPLTLQHDNRRGTTIIADAADVESILAGADGHLTAKDVAAVLFRKRDPDRNAVEKARRRLDAAVEEGTAERVSTAPGEPALWRLAGGSHEGFTGFTSGVHGEGSHEAPLGADVNPGSDPGFEGFTSHEVAV